MNIPEILGWSVIGIVIAQLVVSVSFLVWINLTAFVHKRRLFKFVKTELSAPKKYHFYTLPYKELVEMDRLALMMPRALLRTWGFDPEREMMWWDDLEKECRVFKQEIVDAVE